MLLKSTATIYYLCLISALVVLGLAFASFSGALPLANGIWHP